MERVAVESREIAIVGYDSQARILEVAFRRGGVYQYTQVPEKIHQDLLAAKSLGIFFEQNIKEQFPYQKIK